MNKPFKVSLSVKDEAWIAKEKTFGLVTTAQLKYEALDKMRRAIAHQIESAAENSLLFDITYEDPPTT